MKSNTDLKLEYRRSFLIEELPEPLTPADSHLQIFENYIENTSMRLRKVRDPETKVWFRSLEREQIVLIGKGQEGYGISQFSLDDDEYKAFSLFLGREVRKNRYFFENGDRVIEIDIYLGELWGLQIARSTFENIETKENYELPEFAVLDITGRQFFEGANLVDKTFADVQIELAKEKGE